MGNSALGYARALVVAACLAGILLGACTKKTLSIFFDGVDTPPPPTRRVRRDLLREIDELKRELAAERAAAKAAKERAPLEQTSLPIEQAKTWPEAVAILPRDAAENVDWMQALKAGTIAPRPGLGAHAREQAVLEMDVDLASSGNKHNWVTFPHSAHTEWLTCGNCHPAVFPLKRGAKPTVVTMAKIQAGEYCGVCHGKVAFGVNACARCHAKIPGRTDWRPTMPPRKPIERAATWNEAAKLLPVTQGMPDWAKALADGVIAPRPGLDPKAEDQPILPLDVEMVPANNPLFKVVFPHKAHTGWLACTNCHPGIFQMARGADPITMEKIYKGEYCGACHGKVAFAVPTGCARCHPVMAGGK